MVLKNYVIAPFNSGLTNNLEPWLIPEDAFNILTNAYVWRGRVRKRFGYSYVGNTDLESRLRINIGTTDLAGDISTTAPGTVFAIGQMFSIGDEIFTVSGTGAPATLLDTGAATVKTYNTTNGALVVNGASPSTAVYFYPALPVMGLPLRESITISFESTIAFDTQFAYRRVAGAWERLGTALWTGSDKDFFWTTNYRGSTPYETYLYTVNYVTADNIKYLPEGSTTWTNLRPQLNSGGTRFLETARIILGFKDRLVVLNTKEEDGGVQTFKNRARWSQNGSPIQANAWFDDTPGKGGYIDASTQEAIVTAEFLKDRLIVYFESSTWELVYTGDSTLPFRWQQINTELGAESSFSIIPFDKICVGIGNVGIHSCNGVNVERIDEKIPDEVFKIHNGNDGPERVYGVRDYYRELVYWTFPDAASNPTYPTRVLLWNYQNNTWAIFEDSFTCFGYFQKSSDLTWGTVGNRFGTWAQWNESWNSGQSQSQFLDIVGGNQQGFVFIIETDRSFNEQSLSITNMDTPLQELTIINHNLVDGDYVVINGAQGITLFQEAGEDIVTFKIRVVDSDTIGIDVSSDPQFGWTGTYTGGGTIGRISNLDITSKQWNPGTPVGIQFNFPFLDILLDRTKEGEVSINTYLDFNEDSSIEEEAEPDAILGSSVVRTRPEDDQDYQETQKRIWHRYFLDSIAETLQIKIFLNNDQMRDLSISQSDFQLNGIIIYASPHGRITG
jgi:hypothetical protein